MLTRTLIASIVLIFLMVAPAFSLTSGERSPQFSLLDMNHKKVSLEQFKGRAVYVDFWASWCPSCRRSLPWMSEVQEKYGREKLEVVAINLDEDQEDAVRLLSNFNPSITVLFDPQGDAARIYKVNAMPTSLLIDAQGSIVSVFEGFSEDTEARIEQELERLLK